MSGEDLKKCDTCGETIGSNTIGYVLKIEMFADPEPPEITEEDLEKDWRSEMEKMVEAMKQISPGEAEDEVYERYEYHLCPLCRKKLHDRLKFASFLMG